MRFAITFVAALLAVLTIPATPAGATKPTAPDLQAYTSVPAEGFVVGREAYFQTPDGLLCAMLPDQGRAGEQGRDSAPLPGVGTPVRVALWKSNRSMNDPLARGSSTPVRRPVNQDRWDGCWPPITMPMPSP